MVTNYTSIFLDSKRKLQLEGKADKYSGFYYEAVVCSRNLKRQKNVESN
jgi:hypothetical protein